MSIVLGMLFAVVLATIAYWFSAEYIQEELKLAFWDWLGGFTAADWGLEFRIALFIGACCLHYASLTINIAKIKAKQPHYPSMGLDGEYGKDLKERHSGLGNLSNIVYAKYLVVKEADLKCSGVKYWVGQVLLLLWFWLLFRDRLC